MGFTKKNYKTVISSFDELKNYIDIHNDYIYYTNGEKKGTLDLLLTKYDNNYFNGTKLGLVYVPLSNEKMEIKKLEAYTRGESTLAHVLYQIKNKGRNLSSDMDGRLIVIELDENIEDID